MNNNAYPGLTEILNHKLRSRSSIWKFPG